MSDSVSSKKAVVFGGSRGLGKEVADSFNISWVYSRSTTPSIDFSKKSSVQVAAERVIEHKPDYVFYSAGGGPHGEFFKKPLHAHEWAFAVNYLSPIALAYELIEKKYQGVFIYIGSAIAERSSSTSSLSYSQSKKMAKDVFLSCDVNILDSRVFSPPYMDTDMLPSRAWPRLEAPELVLSPHSVARECLSWLEAAKRGSAVRHFDWVEQFNYTLPSDKDF